MLRTPLVGFVLGLGAAGVVGAAGAIAWERSRADAELVPPAVVIPMPSSAAAVARPATPQMVEPVRERLPVSPPPRPVVDATTGPEIEPAPPEPSEEPTAPEPTTGVEPEPPPQPAEPEPEPAAAPAEPEPPPADPRALIPPEYWLTDSISEMTGDGISEMQGDRGDAISEMDPGDRGNRISEIDAPPPPQK